MPIARIVAFGVILAWLPGVRPAVAEAPWGQSRPYRAEPSPLERLNAGTQKFFADAGAGTKKFFADAGTGTKKFFAQTKNALTWKKPAPKRTPAERMQRSLSAAYLRPEKKPRRSWLGSLFRREEALPSRSLSDFLAAERLDP